MIRNIIFDMGNVLLKFDRNLFLSQIDVDENAKTILNREVFASLEWSMMDRGTISEEDALKRMKVNIPEELHKYADILVKDWDKMTGPVEGMADIVKELKSQGYGIYLLSNASKKIHDYWNSIPGSEYFDGMIVSCDYKLVKPQNEIYHLFEDKFGLNLNECLFIDDNGPNIEAAIYNGMKGIVFHGDIEDLKKKLFTKGILID